MGEEGPRIVFPNSRANDKQYISPMDRKKLVLIGFLHLVQISLTPQTKTVPPMVTILVAIHGL
jgi:hypothetical protein